MAKKNNNTERLPEVIIQKNMESVMHDSMMPYSEHVILERALPRVEDGLKPVQRRILYTCNELAITPDKPHKKSARIVGDCLGKYHPHGDSSVYDALARMAQDFVMRGQLMDGHGNFGSIDGDPPAAMRYTEARLSPLALELLRDIDKDTVSFSLNFDDTLKEPDVLPGRFPNLLVNGATGIAVGLATNIPTHNPGEAIDAVILKLNDPKAPLSEIMKVLPAPDFPTGGILACDEELIKAYETGKGKLTLRAKVHIEASNGGRKLIVIDEIPYQINKSAMLEKILKLSEEKRNLFSGIYDIRDESDRNGMRAVIEIRKDCEEDKILNALYKYSDLQTTIGVNMVAIADGKPMLMGVGTIIDHYIKHQKNVVTRRTKYELDEAKRRAHILEGLIVAVDNLDEVIALIRGSKNPKEAREKLMERFSLTQIQAQAILDMRLQRLTNLEILTLRKEYQDLLKEIDRLEGILNSETKLKNVIKKELLEIKEKINSERKTKLVKGFEIKEITEEAPVADEAYVTLIDGDFIRRLPVRSAGQSNKDEILKRAFVTDTAHKLVFFTDKGNMFTLSVGDIKETKLNTRPTHVSGLLQGLEEGESIVELMCLGNEELAGDLLFISKQGQIKRTAFAEYSVRKSKIIATGLQKNDLVVNVMQITEEQNIAVFTARGMAIMFNTNEVNAMGRAATGVKGMNVSDDDSVLCAMFMDDMGEILLSTERGFMKRLLAVDIEPQKRGGKGIKLIQLKGNNVNGERVCAVIHVKEPRDLTVYMTKSEPQIINSEWVRIDTLKGKGEPIVISVLDDTVARIL